LYGRIQWTENPPPPSDDTYVEDDQRQKGPAVYHAIRTMERLHITFIMWGSKVGVDETSGS
jgi:hypothetical protein